MLSVATRVELRELTLASFHTAIGGSDLGYLQSMIIARQHHHRQLCGFSAWQQAKTNYNWRWLQYKTPIPGVLVVSRANLQSDSCLNSVSPGATSATPLADAWHRRSPYPHRLPTLTGRTGENQVSFSRINHKDQWNEWYTYALRMLT